MRNSRNTLTPTVITDKNGKRTTVYKRVPSVSSVSKSLPARLLQIGPLSQNDLEYRTFRTLIADGIHPSPPAPVLKEDEWVITRNCQYFKTHSPQTITLINRLLTTGNRTSRRLVYNKVTTGLRNSGTEPKNLENSISSAWQCNELIQELNLKTDMFKELNMRTLQYYFNLTGPTVQDKETARDASSYWREIAILMVIDPTSRRHPDFFPWMSQRTDTLRVIEIARSRNTTDPKAIEDVILQQETVHAPLHDGIL